MSIAASVKHIAPVARALTDGNRMVAFKSAHAPAVEVARSLLNPVRANGVGFCERVALESEDQLTKANEVIVGADQAAIEDQVELLAKSASTMIYNASNVIVPAVDTLTNAYIARQSLSMQPNVSVNVYKYHEVHNAPVLVNHVASKYGHVQAFSEYRTFILGQLTAEQIVTQVSENNPHLERQQVVEWLLELGAERISSVWKTLFGTARALDLSRVSFIKTSNWPLQLDELLLAYCLTGSMLENPHDVVGESVDLPEWEKAMAILHELFGHMLLKAYEYRAADAKAQRLVFSSDARDAMRTGIVSVLVNGDIYNSWLANNGDVQALLGAAVYEPNLKSVEAINARAENLSKRWGEYYPVMRQSCLDNTLRSRRREVEAVFLDGSLVLPEGLPALDRSVIRQHVDAELRAVKDAEYECPFLLFANLVCRVYYREQPLYLEFLHAHNRYSKVHPEASGRELAIEALIEMVAAWLASQMTTVGFKPVLVPGATLSTEDTSNVKIDAENQEVAENLGSVEPEPEVNEVAEAEAEQAEAAPEGEEPQAEDESDLSGEQPAEAEPVVGETEVPTDDVQPEASEDDEQPR